ncbi:hypothetical protein M231_04699 [Tremella mesenterica]|uniref:Uncharacterized protein n=1 Tax=Tremella mesenterica TaxID=5217 RepID=A0A4Q1BK74_TREME|nr:hypothetical protein M231_04699 [Tremella mesenterica]
MTEEVSRASRCRGVTSRATNVALEVRFADVIWAVEHGPTSGCWFALQQHLGQTLSAMDEASTKAAVTLPEEDIDKGSIEQMTRYPRAKPAMRDMPRQSQGAREGVIGIRKLNEGGKKGSPLLHFPKRSLVDRAIYNFLLTSRSTHPLSSLLLCLRHELWYSMTLE